MSYILQALQRAQSERESGVAAVRQPRGSSSRPASRSWWAWGIAAALLVNAGVILTVVPSRRDESSDRRDTERAPAPANPDAASPKPADAPQARAKDPAERVASLDARASSMPAAGRTGRSSPGIERAPAADAPSRVEAPARTESVSRVEPARREPSTRPGPSSPAAPRQRLEPPRAAEPASVATAAVPPTAPAAKPSAVVQEALQRLTLQALVYADVPQQRMVFINGRKYLEGDTVDGRFVLEEVTEEGAVLTYQSERFVLHEARGR